MGSEIRLCTNCKTHIPPYTKHIIIRNDVYCDDCVEVTPYTAYVFELNGHYEGNSENDDIEVIEDYEDLYEENE